ncbi:endopolyphosphatase [Obba rivulosa]|uniref:Endopolyphosphatase n=1 Tax=Obba rivulosa TaxID=1052685 RepID=A0A8E2J624_9APHY|nr:endopolyphosphatase [Obba rivulosa]
MLELKLVLLLFLSVFPEGFATPSQVPVQLSEPQVKPPKLQGRFLHITDIHPDPYTIDGGSEKSACHRKKPKKAKRRGGYYGLPFSTKCDSPFSLSNLTLDFLDKEWSSEIDFVIWTGDSARHDNDRKRPRTTAEIYELNRALSRKMETVFSSKGIPVVPSIGNNDVWPHNIMMPGPNSVTSEFSSIWRSFVPFESYQVFQRGGYFSVEVIPNSVAAISLNTMYFYNSNKAVGGCEYANSEDPGNLQFDWLEVQLEHFRQRGMQIIMSGHVPPSSYNFFPECYIRYVNLSLKYQDTILGHLFGHMNADHFFFLEANDLANVPRRVDYTNSDKVEVLKKRKELYNGLLKDFAELPKSSQNTSHGDYGVVNVSPSVVPNPYLPSFRIFTYNITGTPYHPGHRGNQQLAAEDDDSKHSEQRLGDPEPAECDSRGNNSTQPCRPRNWHSSPQAPSRTNRLWTWLGYAQYYMPNLGDSDRKHPPKYKLEYLTYPVESLHPPREATAEAKFHYPIPLKQLPRSLRNATISSSKYAPYEVEDLTIPSWLELARRLGDPAEAKLRKRFKKYMYMGAGGE